MGATGVNGMAVAATAAGGVLVYSGIKGANLSATLTALATGNKPPGPSASLAVTSPTAATPATAPAATPAATTPGAGSYTHASLMALWQQAGGAAGQADNAACHGMQESGGNPKVTSTNPDGGTNVGLWQLDTKGEGAGYTVAQLQNPLLNAQITVMKTGNGTNWSSWATPGC